MECRTMAKLADYMTIKEASAYLGVAPNTLRNWGASGKLEERRHPLNGYRLYKKRELDRLVDRIERSTAGRKKKPR
jgi:DNA (cytosine-5)-methyltransferase 1